MATFIFTASERFDRAVAEPGDNLTNLLQGLSKKKGLGRLFAQLSTLAWAVAASQARAWHPADACMLAHARSVPCALRKAWCCCSAVGKVVGGRTQRASALTLA